MCTAEYQWWCCVVPFVVTDCGCCGLVCLLMKDVHSTVVHRHWPWATLTTSGEKKCSRVFWERVPTACSGATSCFGSRSVPVWRLYFYKHLYLSSGWREIYDVQVMDRTGGRWWLDRKLLLLLTFGLIMSVCVCVCVCFVLVRLACLHLSQD